MLCNSFKASINAFQALEEAYQTLQRERQALQKIELGPTTNRLERWGQTYRHKYHRHSWAPAYSRPLHDVHSSDSRFGDRRGRKQARWRPRSVLPIGLHFGCITHSDSTYHPDTDPDCGSRFLFDADADPDPTFRPVADADPNSDTSFQIKAQTLEKELT